MEVIRILQIVPNMQAGGLESYIMNLYRNIDRNKIQFDFLVHYKERKHFDDEIESLGGKIYRFSLRDDNNLFKYKRELNDFFKNHKEYRVIHCHMASVGAIIFKIAKKHGVEVRIQHSHNSTTDKTLKGRVKAIMIRGCKKYSTLNLACSNDAGKYLFKNRPYKVVPNAIDMNNFKYDEDKRIELRRQFDIDDDCFVLGNVGRFNVQKNHLFLLEVFKIFKNSNKAKLLLIGSGEKEKEIRNYINDNGLNKDVIILQNRKDVNELYNMMDCFILPSLFEGLPLVAIEEQVNGLKGYYSSNITKDVDISNNVEFVDIDDAEKFANSIKLQFRKDRDLAYHKLKDSEYNTRISSTKMQTLYLDLYTGCYNE